MIDHGRVIAEGTSRELKASVGSNALHVRLGDPGQRAEAQRLITRVLGDGVMPSSEPTELAARLENAAQATAVLSALTDSGSRSLSSRSGIPASTRSSSRSRGDRQRTRRSGTQAEAER